MLARKLNGAVRRISENRFVICHVLEVQLPPTVTPGTETTVSDGGRNISEGHFSLRQLDLVNSL